MLTVGHRVLHRSIGCLNEGLKARVAFSPTAGGETIKKEIKK